MAKGTEAGHNLPCEFVSRDRRTGTRKDSVVYLQLDSNKATNNHIEKIYKYHYCSSRGDWVE